eukprot:2966930-Prymnesium_polylepis.2
MSILRTLAANPGLCASMPKFEPQQPSAQGVFSALGGDGAAQKLLEDARAKLRESRESLCWPTGERMADGPPPQSPRPKRAPLKLRPLRSYRSMLVPRAPDSGCGERLLKAAAGGEPLAVD